MFNRLISSLDERMRFTHYRRHLPRRKNGLAQSVEGVTALEFAFIVPVFLLMIMAIIEFSMIMFTMSVMESATNTTGRLGKTGYVPPGVTRQQAIIDSIKDHSNGLLDPSKITVTTMVYASFDKVGQPEPFTDTNHNGTHNSGEPYTDVNGNGQWDTDMGIAGLGNSGDVVVYTVVYPWPIMTPVMKQVIGGTYPITVRTVVKNEPY